ncbi:MAG TPA: hypothetical protein VGL13_07130, partial [Polyangiaceae bacterium]
SSLGESASCQDAKVHKLPLSAACVGIDYDITREQPQLFVARDFDHLHQVLDEVTAGLAQSIGGEPALTAAQKSGEVATVELDSGAQIIGCVDAVERSDAGPAFIRWSGRVGVAGADRLFDAPSSDVDTVVALLGPLIDGRSASRMTARDIDAEVELRFRSGVVVRGRLRASHMHADARVAAVDLGNARVERGGRLMVATSADKTIRVVLGDRVATAFAGAADASYWLPNEPTFRRVPAPREPRSRIDQLDRLPTLPPSSAAFAAIPPYSTTGRHHQS